MRKKEGLGADKWDPEFSERKKKVVVLGSGCYRAGPAGWF
jgi:hypothetical protein